MTKMLIALDESPSAMKAVEYVAQQFGRSDDIEVSLVHVLPNLPAIFWDEGHILSENEKQDRKKVVDKWLLAQKAKIEPLFNKAANMLAAKGMPAARIRTKFVSDSTDIADSILEEARDSDCRAIIVGRSHHSPKHVLGTVAGRIAGQGAGMVVTIVE
ncbi:MAG TPA: universal stress protein [Nitrospirota bacterium]|nr:universal stress protein [Nitrospirota bacterium]